MSSLNDFSEWMRQNTGLADSSIGKYKRAVNTISNEMQEKGIIKSSLLSMSTLQLDVFVPVILRDSDFQAKNLKGNHMYSNALKQYRLFRNIENPGDTDQYEAESMINDCPHLQETERVALIKSRIGQGIFRDNLMNKYHGRCVITGISEKKLLIASHVKPWAVSSNTERLSAENGLLLSPTFDKLFDCGLISFTDAGKILISSQLSSEVTGILHVSAGDSFDLMISNELKTNLEYHRDVVFTKN